jgi:K+-sensing histidine kinase KdpD
MDAAINTAILVIDDEEMVRDNIEEILLPRKHNTNNDSIDFAANILFDTPKPLLSPRSSNIPNFTVDKASNGMEGVAMVKKAVANGHPYAVIFLDMRMPGWDGLETAVHIREHDNKAEIIFVTAFSDRSIEDIVTRAGQNVGYHCKPYASEEIIQLASKAVSDYNKLRNLENLIKSVSSISIDEQHLFTLLKNILDQLAAHLQTDMALLGKLREDYSYEKLFSIGALEEKINLKELIARVDAANLEQEEVVQVEEIVMVKIEDYIVFAVLTKNEQLKTEKMYLLKLFVQGAAKAIRNAELYEKLLQKEKLSAVGNAIGMVMHDLRSPIKNISVLTNILRQEGMKSQWLDAIDECAVQASEIFDDFLDFIKETAAKKLPVNLLRTIAGGIKLAEARHDLKSVTVNKNIPVDIVIKGDESKLRRAIMNIVSNAAEALTGNKIANPVIDIAAQKNDTGTEVVLVIKDNGPGIPQAILKTLFEPFITTGKSNGTGLGLAIVKQYITAHGGSVVAANEGGAVFTIILPLGGVD